MEMRKKRDPVIFISIVQRNEFEKKWLDHDSMIKLKKIKI